MATIHHNINQLQLGEKKAGVYLVKNHAVKQTNKGNPYLDIVLVDKTGEISGKWWNIQGFNCDTIVDSDFIVVKYLVEDYNGNKQLRIENLKLVDPTTDFDPADIIPVSPEDPKLLYQEIYNVASSFNNNELKKLTLNILDERKDALLKMPAAKSVHHAVVGGLLLHTAGMLRSAKALSSVYKSFNEELLYCGVILHDICKLDEFFAGPLGIVTDYTSCGKLLGHLHMGAAYIENKCKELDISNETSLVLAHMILSHHGEPEFGSAVRPMFIEASLLHMLDLIDSRVYMFNDVTKDMEDNTFSQKIFMLDNVQVYKHNINKKRNDTVDFYDLPEEPTEDMF